MSFVTIMQDVVGGEEGGWGAPDLLSCCANIQPLWYRLTPLLPLLADTNVAGAVFPSSRTPRHSMLGIQECAENSSVL